MKVTRHALAGERYFPAQKRAGSIAMHVAYVAPPETISAVKRLYYLAIAAAKREVLLQNPYFIPDRHAIALCAHAAARGVAVKLMLPTSETSDFPSCSTPAIATTVRCCSPARRSGVDAGAMEYADAPAQADRPRQRVVQAAALSGAAAAVSS